MPLYEYECDACGHRFEKIVKFSDAPIETCPACAGTIRKLISSPAFQFKGTGFYITDYARKDQPGEGQSAKGSGTDGNASTTSSKDEPAAKASDGTSTKASSAKSDTAPAASSTSSKSSKD